MMTQKRKEQGEGCPPTVQDETILKISKEIAVKFIEVGRITPATFGEQFREIYTAIEETVKKNGN